MAEPRAGRVLRGARSLLDRAPVVLMYHGFCHTRRPDDAENLFVEVARFEEQLTWLAEHGWTALDLDGYLEVLDGRRPGHRTFLVTIDDGYDSVAELAAPVLQRHGVPAVLFVLPGLLGGTAEWPPPTHEPLLDAAALRLLPERGIEVALHGHDHQDLRGMGRADLDRQVTQARAKLAQALGREVRAFAYPFGSHDAEARRAVERAGFGFAFSVFDDVGRFAISRVDVNATDTVRSFRVKMLPHYRRVWRALERAPQIRRIVRRVSTRHAPQRR